MRLTITSDVARVEAAFARSATVVPEALHAGIAVAAEGVQAVIVPAIKLRTPVKSGALQASATSTATDVPDGVDIAVSEPAKSKPNQDGSGGGFQYVEAVLRGRAAITAPSQGAWSTGKLALRTPWGPRKSVRASKPNDFVTPAIADARQGMRAATHDGAVVAAKVIVGALK